MVVAAAGFAKLCIRTAQTCLDGSTVHAQVTMSWLKASMGTEKPKPRAQGSHLGRWAQALAGQLKAKPQSGEGASKNG